VEGLTIIRIRGVLTLNLDSADAAGSGFEGAFGIAIADNVAIAAGAGSLPSPQTESEDEVWMYHDWFHLTATDATLLGSQNPASLMSKVDSKAMRKLPVGKSMYAILEVVESGTSVLRWYFDSRILAKLP